MITFIVGLPGSGKTMLARSIAEAHRANFPERPIRIIDDPRTPEEHAAISVAICEDGDVFVCDPYLCLPRIRKIVAAEFPGALWIFFANDPAACRANVARRNDGRVVDGFIGLLAQSYSPPENALSVWRPLDTAT